MGKKNNKNEKWDFKSADSYHKEWTCFVLDMLARPLSIFLIKYTPISANTVSIMTLITAIIGCIFFIMGGYKNQVIGVLFILLHSVLDMADGRVARARRTPSKFGKWLDAMIDFTVFPMVIFSLALGMQSYLAAVLAILAVVSFQNQFLIIHFYKLEIIGSKKLMKMPQKFEWIRYAYGYNFFYLFLLVAVLLGYPLLVLFLWATLGNLYWIVVIFVQGFNIKRLESKK